MRTKYENDFKVMIVELLKPALCIRNLLHILIDYHSVTCADFVTHHSGAMSALQKPVRAPD